MSDPRIIAVAVALVIALGVAAWARRRERRRAVSAPLDLSGLRGRVLFFSDATCTRCDIVRAHLDGLGAEYTEIAYDRDPDTHRRVGVTGVPLVEVRDDDGNEVRRFAGAMPRTRLAMALGLHRD